MFQVAPTLPTVSSAPRICSFTIPTSLLSAAALRVRSVSMLSADCDGACLGQHLAQKISSSPKSETLYVLSVSLSPHSQHVKSANAPRDDEIARRERRKEERREERGDHRRQEVSIQKKVSVWIYGPANGCGCTARSTRQGSVPRGKGIGIVLSTLL